MSVEGSGASSSRFGEKGLGLALEVLEQVAAHHEGITAADIARAVGAPRATVYRTVNALVRDGYLVRRPDFSGFLLGARVLELAAIVDAHRRPAHRDVLDEVRTATGEAVHLVAFHRSGLAIVDEDPAQPLSDRAIFLSDPTRSAPGHVWLVEQPSLPEPAGVAVERWRVTPPSEVVSAIHAAYAARGYAERVGGLSAGRGCLAVSITDDDGHAIGALTLSTPVSRFSLAARHLDALRDAARSLRTLAQGHPVSFS